MTDDQRIAEIDEALNNLVLAQASLALALDGSDDLYHAHHKTRGAYIKAEQALERLRKRKEATNAVA